MIARMIRYKASGLLFRKLCRSNTSMKYGSEFQARSACTGVGFTISESEKVVNHLIRCQIPLLLMLLGNAGVVTAVLSLIVSFVNINHSDALVWQVALLVAGLLILWSLASSKRIDRLPVIRLFGILVDHYYHTHQKILIIKFN